MQGVVTEVIVKGYIEFGDENVSPEAADFASVIDALGKAIEKEFAWLRCKSTFDPLENFIINLVCAPAKCTKTKGNLGFFMRGCK